MPLRGIAAQRSLPSRGATHTVAVTTRVANPEMLILGDISGIQGFLFALPEEEGGQARMLRARSFFLQILTESLAFRVQRALGLPRDSLLFCAAGRFAIEASDDLVDAAASLDQERAEVERWLARNTAGEITFALGWSTESSAAATPAQRYESALLALQRSKLRPWSASAVDGEWWRPDRLVLDAVDRHAEDKTFRLLGEALPGAARLVLREAVDDALATNGATPAVGLPGLRATLEGPGRHGPPPLLSADLRVAAWAPGPASPDTIRRPLARHVPKKPDGSPVLFEELVRAARGAPYLGWLKMDADSLGAAIADRLASAKDLGELARFSNELDDFFAIELTALLEQPKWASTYTVFAGGDDLLLVGPWDRMLDLAGEVQRRFANRFGDAGLTISGGLAVVRYRYPTRRAAAQVEALLERAKAEPAAGATAPKDQFAALGQVWKWKEHAAITRAATRLADWVASGRMERGWLHTMLRFVLLHRGDASEEEPGDRALAIPRLTYHVARNFPRPDDADADRRAIRRWADRIVSGLAAGDASDAEVVYLPAILRYALLATRTATREEAS